MTYPSPDPYHDLQDRRARRRWWLQRLAVAALGLAGAFAAAPLAHAWLTI